MKRRTFVKLSTISGIAVTAFPNLSFNIPFISTEELMGKGSPELFGNNFKLRKEAYEAFLEMKSEALNDNIEIQVVSSYRNFEHQNRIWTRKYKSFTQQGLSPMETIKKIIEYSTIPGTSRHHWGTDMDIIDGNPKQPKNVLLSKHFEGDGPFTKLKEWMDTNANKFGFYLVYTDDDQRNGFKYEPWHYSYKPLSEVFLKEYLELDILELLKNEKIIGKENFSTEFFNNYLENNILDINPELLS